LDHLVGSKRMTWPIPPPGGGGPLIPITGLTFAELVNTGTVSAVTETSAGVYDLTLSNNLARTTTNSAPHWVIPTDAVEDPFTDWAAKAIPSAWALEVVMEVTTPPTMTWNPWGAISIQNVGSSTAAMIAFAHFRTTPGNMEASAFGNPNGPVYGPGAQSNRAGNTLVGYFSFPPVSNEGDFVLAHSVDAGASTKDFVFGTSLTVSTAVLGDMRLHITTLQDYTAGRTGSEVATYSLSYRLLERLLPQ
jgi:hypothetical protein